MGFIKNFEELATTPQRKVVLELIETALSSIQPENVMNEFQIENNELKIKEKTFKLEDFENIYLIGFGKGSASISKIIEQKLAEKLTEGYDIDLPADRQVSDEPAESEARHGRQFSKVQFTLGTHPLPSQINIDFTKKVVDRFKNKLNEQDLVLVVVCGGGSALFELPIEGKTLEDLLNLNSELLKSGKTIKEMNIERKKFSQVKGGGLARLLSPAKVVGLIFSDVPGNDISTIASGPTDETSATNIFMLSNRTALEAMKKKADELGIRSQIYFDAVQGEARIVGTELIKTAQPNAVLLAAGETTVTVRNKQGEGGRNQELVLGALSNSTIEQLNNVTIASFDTDGWDNSEFAGAIGNFQTVEHAKKMNLNLEEFLNNNNSFDFFQKTGDAIITGRLSSNVSDIMIVFKS